MHTYQTPISLPPVETPLSVAARQEDADAEIHVITQTIYRPSTTFVTYVTLGGGLPTSYADGHSDEPPPVASPTVAPPPPDRSSGSLSSVQIGAILGGIVAFVAIVLIAWFCVSQKRPEPHYPPSWYEYDSFTESSATPTIVRPPSTRPHPRDPRLNRPHPPMPQPPPPAFNVNHYKQWEIKFNGPFRRQQPPPPHRYRTRFPRS
ncbi:uncharacterized protein LY79DRAFT_562654 [Colletotrichum navitas]|uniref:Transmembrane protein n=1 Tax=Colletotrichum navitas TaxID=681940 RepID=A0AAD8PSP1_9PEZI|nr:uncharacterized protein LY79DRAFT_562654 [Colletotrichum navitas]KAK1580038.1 hypothetical protein LY79DRAFT_562654 [Colletotrichum navitas]